jgi:hypothetical protein
VDNGNARRLLLSKFGYRILYQTGSEHLSYWLFAVTTSRNLRKLETRVLAHNPKVAGSNSGPAAHGGMALACHCALAASARQMCRCQEASPGPTAHVAGAELAEPRWFKASVVRVVDASGSRRFARWERGYSSRSTSYV